MYYWSGFLAYKVLGVAVIAFGLLVASTGVHWQEPVTEFLLGPAWSANLVLWLPYWPFEPYFSLFIIGLGTFFVTVDPDQTHGKTHND